MNRHPVFRLCMERATASALHRGEITQDESATIHAGLRRPHRRDRDNNEIHFTDALHDHVCGLIEDDQNVPREVRASVRVEGFGWWDNLKQWFADHWKDILKFVLPLLLQFLFVL